MARHPCVQCPFREESSYGYDNDAHAALADGNAPSCHMQVGSDKIFAHAPMDPANGIECAGYIAWLNDVRGYRMPCSSSRENGPDL